MTILTPPTAAAVRIESRLLPKQVSRDYANDAALEADVAARIAKYTPVLEKKLVNVTDSADNQTIATEALQLRVLASLYGTAGQLHPAYWERAQAYREQSNELMEVLLADAEDPSLVAGGAGTLSTAAYRLDENGLPVVNGAYYD